MRTRAIDQALVFTRTKHGANKLAEQLWQDGIATAAIHGNKSQPQRIRALSDFKAGRVTLLIATEVAARGLDIEQLPHVVNYELPMVPSDYVHRIGRTGRAGTQGDAISLVCIDEMPLLRDIERLLGAPIPSQTVAGFEPDPSVRPSRFGCGPAVGTAASVGAAQPMANGDRSAVSSRGASVRHAPRAGPPSATARLGTATGRACPANASGARRTAQPSRYRRPASMMRCRNCARPRLARRREDPIRRPLLEDLTVVQEEDARGDVAREAHLVGGDDHGHARCRQIAHDIEHLRHQLRVEGGGDLVQQQQGWLHGQRPHDRHALLLAAGQPIRVLEPLVGQAEALQQTRWRPRQPRRRGVRIATRGASVTFSSTVMCGNRL